MQQQVWRELFTRAASAAAAARVNNSRHIVSGIWLRYFFKDDKPTASQDFFPSRQRRLNSSVARATWEYSTIVSRIETKFMAPLTRPED